MTLLVREPIAVAAPPRRRFPIDSSWWWTLAVAGLAIAVRLWRLGFPDTMVFDEHYYVPEAGELLRYGVEWNSDRDSGDSVSHPPLGKWCIALGTLLFGDHPTGWRLPAVLAGVAAVLMVTRLSIRLFGSTALGVVAGLLMSADGLHYVLSRTAVLDVFLMTFLLGAFGCAVMARQRPDRRLRWDLGMALLLGLALGVKWSALWYVLALLALTVAWRWRQRRLWLAVLAIGAMTAGMYLVTWSGWLISQSGWGRHWLAAHGHAEPPVLGALVNLGHYHYEMFVSGVGLDAPHGYQSQPWQWLLMTRPVMFWWTNAGPCGAPRCDTEILLLGTPLLWWSFIPALAIIVWRLVRTRDWRPWAIAAGAGAGLLPWLLFPDRTKYVFYALPAQPFLILAVVYAFHLWIRNAAGHGKERVANRHIVLFGYTTAIVACFAYYFPLFSAVTMTHDQWWARLWWLGERWV